MSTATITPSSVDGPAVATRPREREVPAPIPFGRILGVELRKMFDTRSGFWLMASIVITSGIATVLTVLLSDRDELTFDSFAASVGSPMSIILPIIGVLAVTSEWTQRTALTTFTLVPSRGRVIGAKLVDVLVIGAVSMVIALGVGAAGNLVNSAITGNDAVWDIPAWTFAQIVLANELGMLLGFALGLLFRSSPGGDRRLLRGQPGAARHLRCAGRGAEVVGRQRRLVRREPDPLPALRLEADLRGVAAARPHVVDLDPAALRDRPRPRDAVRGQVGEQ